jgi:hypothetical protein
VISRLTSALVSNCAMGKLRYSGATP